MPEILQARLLPQADNRGIFTNAAVSTFLLRQAIESKLPRRMEVGTRVVAEGILTKLNHEDSECLL